MSLNISQQTFGYILIVLGILVAIAGWISYQKGGRMKVITYVVCVVVSIGLGIKFAFSPEKKPMEVKEVSFPKKPVRQ